MRAVHTVTVTGEPALSNRTVDPLRSNRDEAVCADINSPWRARRAAARLSVRPVAERRCDHR
jgi:hypothetical protein